MSDISIPGVNSKYGTQGIIDSLVKVEKNKLVKMESDKKALEDTKLTWQETNKYMQNVRDAAKSLYGFNNPFGSKVGTTTDEKSVSVAATRAASNGEYRVKVLSPASNDRFLSKSMPKDYTVPAGDYQFKVGEKEINLAFKGGKLQAFADALSLKKPDLLKAAVIKDSADTQILQIEAVPVGAKNALEFGKASQNVLKELGILGPPEGFKTVLQEGETSLEPGAKQSWKPEKAVSYPAGTEVRFQVKVSEASAASSATPLGFVAPLGGAVTFEGITIEGAAMKADIPPPPPPAPPPEVRNMKGLSLVGPQGKITLGELPDSPESSAYAFVLKEAGTLESLDLVNNNSARRISVTGVTLVDPKTSNSLLPRNALSRAADASLEYEGIKVTRDTNSVSDVIPGVTLNLLAASEEPVKIKVEPDKKAIKEGIITFMANYNRLMTDILVLTTIRSTNPASSPIITEASYLTDAEKSRAESNLGKFQGDLSLNQIKSGLQRVMMNAYATDGSPFTVLSQIGISTNASNNGDKVNVSKLRGYLELDEPVWQHH